MNLDRRRSIADQIYDELAAHGGPARAPAGPGAVRKDHRRTVQGQPDAGARSDPAARRPRPGHGRSAVRHLHRGDRSGRGPAGAVHARAPRGGDRLAALRHGRPRPVAGARPRRPAERGRGDRRFRPLHRPRRPHACLAVRYRPGWAGCGALSTSKRRISTASASCTCPEPGKIRQVAEQHVAILDAIEAGDRAATEARVREHTSGSVVYLETLLVERPELFDTPAPQPARSRQRRFGRMASAAPRQTVEALMADETARHPRQASRGQHRDADHRALQAGPPQHLHPGRPAAQPRGAAGWPARPSRSATSRRARISTRSPCSRIRAIRSATRSRPFRPGR